MNDIKIVLVCSGFFRTFRIINQTKPTWDLGTGERQICHKYMSEYVLIRQQPVWKKVEHFQKLVLEERHKNGETCLMHLILIDSLEVTQLFSRRCVCNNWCTSWKWLVINRSLAILKSLSVAAPLSLLHIYASHNKVGQFLILPYVMFHCANSTDFFMYM